MQDSLLIIGIHTRPAVFSAKALGFYTASVDYFGDVDLKEVSDLSRSIRKQRPFESSGRISECYDGGKLVELAKDIHADRTIVTCSLNFPRKTLGNPPEVMFRLKDKEFQLKKVRKLGVSVPDYEVVKNSADAREAAANLGFPCILKPVRGAGGRGVSIIMSGEEIHEIEEPHLVQRYVTGTHISTSTLSTKNDSMLLSTSEQILGQNLVGQEGFVYCGSIVPFNIKRREFDELENLSIKISKSCGVVGWNGLDFVVGDEPVFIEVNPRFQGTFECIEQAYGINLLDGHMKACDGELIKAVAPSKTSMRLTLFAKETCIVRDDLRGKTVDVPLKNSIIEKGEPITTVVGSGTRMEAINRCTTLAKKIYAQSLFPWTP